MIDPPPVPGTLIKSAPPAAGTDVKAEKRDLLEYSIADLVAIAYQRGMEGGSIEGEDIVG